MWEILFWVAFSTAAVFGLICALWLLADWLCGSRTGVAVRILDHEAREIWIFCCPRQRIFLVGGGISSCCFLRSSHR